MMWFALIVSFVANVFLALLIVEICQQEAAPLPEDMPEDPAELASAYATAQQMIVSINLRLANAQSARDLALSARDEALARANMAEDQLSEAQSDLEDMIDAFGPLDPDDEE